MKHLLFAVIIGTAAMFGTPAAAHVVQATSSLALAGLDVDDNAKLEQALKTAVDQVLKDTIAFERLCNGGPLTAPPIPPRCVLHSRSWLTSKYRASRAG